MMKPCYRIMEMSPNRLIPWTTLKLMIFLSIVSLINAQWLEPDFNGKNIGSNKNHLVEEQRVPKGRLLAMDKSSHLITPLLPGLLDETLLKQGSFAFGSKLVKIDKLKVLGNVYVDRINGKLLRESYLLKNSMNDETDKKNDKVDAGLLKKNMSNGKYRNTMRLKLTDSIKY